MCTPKKCSLIKKLDGCIALLIWWEIQGTLKKEKVLRQSIQGMNQSTIWVVPK